MSSPNEELVSLHQAKQRVKLPLDVYDEDDALRLQLQIAHAIVLDYVKQRLSGATDWALEVDSWSASTVPVLVKGSILEQFAYQYRFRGDDEDAQRRDGTEVICPNAKALVYRLRDAALA